MRGQTRKDPSTTAARALALLACGLLLGTGVLAAQETLPADAYRDVGARELVRLARARRATVDTRITAYQTTARERVSAHAGVGGLDRLLMRRETVSRVDWTRDTVRIELIGAREAQPLVSRSPQMPSPFVAGQMPSLAFDPLDSEMLLRVDSTLIRHPLAAGAEANYRYASGESASIRLPDGRVVRLVELRITARRPDSHLINGSFWLDADSHAVVRAALRQSRAVSANRRGVGLLLPAASATVEHVAIEYGLVDLRWWLPRTVQARGAASVAGLRLAPSISASTPITAWRATHWHPSRRRSPREPSNRARVGRGSPMPLRSGRHRAVPPGTAPSSAP